MTAISGKSDANAMLKVLFFYRSVTRFSLAPLTMTCKACFKSKILFVYYEYFFSSHIF